MLITSKTGETASFPCDLTHGAIYIHLYKHEEGMAPRRLLYYDSYNSKPVLESGISGAKYHVYKGTGRSYTFAILNLQASDSGIYYCAIWDKHVGSDFLYTALEILLVAENHSPDISSCFTPSRPISFYSKQRKTLNSMPMNQALYSMATFYLPTIVLVFPKNRPPSPVCRQAVWQAAYSQLSQKLVDSYDFLFKTDREPRIICEGRYLGEENGKAR